MPYSSLIRESRIGCFGVRPLFADFRVLFQRSQKHKFFQQRARLGREEVRPHTVDSATFQAEAAALWL
jgi:hypothetical protein